MYEQISREGSIIIQRKFATYSRHYLIYNFELKVHGVRPREEIEITKTDKSLSNVILLSTKEELNARMANMYRT